MDETKTKKVTKLIFAILLVFLIIGIIITLGVYAINHMPESIKTIGATATSTAIPETGIIGTIIKVILGVKPPITYENLILFLAIFFIIAFALADILPMFTTFNETTSWAIAIGLAVIAGVTKSIAGIATIFGITAGIGAIGIAIIIIMGILAAVVINIGLGTKIQAWALQRQIGVQSAKTTKGFAKATNAAKGLKEMAEEISKGETS